MNTAVAHSPGQGQVELILRHRQQALTALAAFRFFSFALGVGILYTLGDAQEERGIALALAATVALFNVVRVFLHAVRVRWPQGVEMGLVVVEGAAVLSLVLATGGLDSAFLVHSVTPVLCASLLLDKRTAFGLASGLGVLMFAAHVAGGPSRGPLPGLLTGNLLAVGILYLTALGIAAALPFLSNLNVRRRQQMLALEEERQRLQREVHDDIAQTLAFLSLKVQGMQQAEQTGPVLVQADDILAIARGLQRSYLTVRDYLSRSGQEWADESLGRRLQSTAHRWGQDTRIPVQVRVFGEEPKLPPGVKLHLLQIAREALANAARHAQPRSVSIELGNSGDQVSLRVVDNGRGFPPTQPKGLGLRGMEERAALIGASLEVQSARGQGTVVSVRLPLAPKAEAS